jgi:type IV pilus assembly protein PilB
MAIKRKYIGELLIDMGMITQQQLDECLKEQKSSGERIGRILRNKGYVTEQQLMEIMEFQLGIPLINLDTVTFSHALAKYIPVALAKKAQKSCPSRRTATGFMWR